MRDLGLLHKHRSRTAGFTLLEIMVAMLLLTVIITSSTSLLFLNIRGWDALSADSEQALDEVLISERINGSLRNLMPIIRQTPAGRRLLFLGEAKQLHFVSTAPQQFRSGGLFEYLLREEPDNENRLALVLYYTPYRPDATEFVLPNEGSKRTLIADTGGISFSYYGSKKRIGQPEWSDSWESELESYPQFVKLTQSRDRAGAGEETRFIRLLMASSARLR